ncbi:uncharacterized protein LOC136066120 [Quercus suber]|uniref:Bifunctional inhibitor/plant lipid transfer protein/seed storage helical domain-containing protein n=1 Tax=Quercus suber TaxID=58331 RepID=A0AAW0M1R4_QUESU
MAMYIHTNIFLLAFFAITMILFSSNMVVGRRCQGEQDLMSQCAAFVRKDGPKAYPHPICCGAIQKADIPCICKQLNSQMEKKIDMNKVVFVAKMCNKPLAPGSKCGDFNVPPVAYIG